MAMDSCTVLTALSRLVCMVWHQAFAVRNHTLERHGEPHRMVGGPAVAGVVPLRRGQSHVENTRCPTLTRSSPPRRSLRWPTQTSYRSPWQDGAAAAGWSFLIAPEARTSGRLPLLCMRPAVSSRNQQRPLIPGSPSSPVFATWEGLGGREQGCPCGREASLAEVRPV